MKKFLILVLGVFLAAGFVFLSPTNGTKEKRIGVIVPMEHQALNDIVNGLREGLEGKASLKVMNAQGDPNIQRAIIQQLIKERCEVLVPIGTAASQMTLNLSKGQEQNKIVCLATNLTVDSTENGPNAAFLNDELSANDSLSFLQAAFPGIKKMTLVYSASEKVADEIPIFQEAARSRNVQVQKLMVQTLPELYTISHSIAPDSEAIFILKDHLIVSGIQTLAQQAERLGIPVMTSDEGSIISGGAFAIGVKEAEIGRQGASIVKAVLDGASPRSIAPQSIKGPFPLFVNGPSCKRQGIDLEAFIKKAEALGFPIEFTDESR